MSLVRAERRRFFKRRLTRWLVPIGILILTGIAAALFFVHSKPTAEARAAAEVQAEQAYQRELGYFEQYKAECEKHNNGQPCQGPGRENFPAESFMPPSFDFKQMFQPLLLIWASIIGMIAFVLGATFIGAEWASGSMMNLLTWRPKRMSVLGTKLAVLLGGITAIALTTLALWTAALWATGVYRGTTEGLTSGVWQSFGLSALRGLALILAFAVLGFGLASIGRHTGLALGVALGVVIVGQIGLRIVLELAGVKFADQYLVPMHIFAWMDKEAVLQDWSGAVSCDQNGCNAPELVLTWQGSGSIALGVIVVVLALAFWQMRRRDIS
ncbi:ABC transporter permease subunit [Catellatospora citrea]|uniref:ABC-type transport system involved in multi-copper enzyme maturation permease subunit n=1 Tax=Catellatospora citrea TaxID=53366 RepID=A0A8J3P2N1_9ACTN|nr:ABC transporter permease subunit [Catellatospora citrea]RKE08572.1 ABC-type transport system involved in multi-copper enzyme maturation permease subunit [Catellatospora citrea]GIG01699.1 hypothetical protein Cci01nite_67920 [Catellatospora citrea]